MINKKELKIGNWVYPNSENNTPYPILELTHNGVVCYRGKTEHERDVIIDYSEIEPIPLSKDILYKAGFQKHINSNEYWNIYNLPNGFYISEALHTEPAAGVKKGLFYEGEEYTELEFLHWLQNFYFFSCNGRELDINFNI